VSLAQIRSVAQAIYPDLRAIRMVIARDIVEPQFRPWQLGTRVFTLFAALAVIITSVGVLGTVSTVIALKSREIGIRMALGARSPHVLRTVVSEGFGSMAVGLLIGGVVIAIGSRWLGPLLFQTSTTDGSVLFQTAATILLSTAAATVFPAIRAIQTDPVRVLKGE
jgi:ABC-type antimicrobial peptide transport system permease subunit